MARRSLRPQLNQIRAWVRQGRTDAWIAHQLEVTVQEIERFRGEHALGTDDADGQADHGEDFDLRAEDDALIAAELDAAAEQAAKEAAEAAEAAVEAGVEEGGGEGEDDEARAASRRRGRRGGRGRRRAAAGPYEATFDHGEEGYGMWFDPAIQDDPVYAEHWAGHRPVEVAVEEDQIVIRRAAAGDDD